MPRSAASPRTPLLLLSTLALAGCGKSGQEWASNVGQAVDRTKVQGAAADMRTLYASVQNYVTGNGDLPAAADIHALAEVLEPQYQRLVKRTDPWGQDYGISIQGDTFVVTSSGQDRAWGTEDDLECTNGQMTKIPQAFKRL